MGIAKLIAQFWVSVAMLAVITLLSIFLIVFVLRSKTSSCSETWTEKERTRIRWLKIGTAIAVLLCWLGVSSQPGFATFGEWCDQLVSVQRRYPLWRYPLFGGQ